MQSTLFFLLILRSYPSNVKELTSELNDIPVALVVFMIFLQFG